MKYVISSAEKSFNITEKREDCLGNYYSAKVNSTFGPKLLGSISRDLVRVAQGVFMADRAFRRSTKVGNQTRTIYCTIPLENPESFSSLKTLIQEAAHYASRDWWYFQFIKLTEVHNVDHTKASPTPPKHDFDCISLFSDGLDSLGGATQLLTDKCRNPFFVLHRQQGRWTFNRAYERLKGILEHINLDKSPGVGEFLFQISDKDDNGKRNMFPEHSRRSRPFFYLFLAMAWALELQVPTIYLNENGPLAINLPLNEGKLGGAYISRHAHPQVFRSIEKVFNRLWKDVTGTNASCTIVNPLFGKTKSEIVKHLLSSGISQEMILQTVSCENAARPLATIRKKFKERKAEKRDPKQIKECGLCAPCFIKKYALVSNGIPTKNQFAFDHLLFHHVEDKDLPYNKDDYKGLAKNILLSFELSEFCERITHLSKYHFVNQYFHEISLLINSNDHPPSKLIDEVYDLLCRFSQQYLQYVKSHERA